MASDAPRNYAIFAIPAYLVLAMLPHAYSMTLLRVSTSTVATEVQSKKKPSKPAATATANANDSGSLYNMTLPRAAQASAHYSSNLPTHIYERYERARAAHANMFENAAFVVSAVLAGVVARVDARSMNIMCGSYLLSRVLYTVSYIADPIGGVRERAGARTVWYVVGNAVLMWMWWAAGLKVLRDDH